MTTSLNNTMSSLMYTILCALCSLLVIALADYAYKTMRDKWGPTSSHARRQAERDHNNVAQHLVAAQNPEETCTTTRSDAVKSETAPADKLQEYAKALLKDSKT